MKKFGRKSKKYVESNDTDPEKMSSDDSVKLPDNKKTKSNKKLDKVLKLTKAELDEQLEIITECNNNHYVYRDTAVKLFDTMRTYFKGGGRLDDKTIKSIGKNIIHNDYYYIP